MVLERPEWEAVQDTLRDACVHIGRRREAEEGLRRAQRETMRLLLLALHELANATGERRAQDRAAFARHWISEHRQPDFEGVPFTRNGSA